MGYSPLGFEVLMLPTIAASRQDSESVESKGLNWNLTISSDQSTLQDL